MTDLLIRNVAAFVDSAFRAGRHVIVKDGAIRMTNGTLAGSGLSMR